jgi:hypothetical protein
MSTLRRRKPDVNSKLENLAQIDKLARRILDDLLDNQELINFATKHVLQRLGHNPNNTVVCSPADVDDYPGYEYIFDTTDEEQLYYSLIGDVNLMVLHRAVFLLSQDTIMPPTPSMRTETDDEQTFEEYEGEDHGH